MRNEEEIHCIGCGSLIQSENPGELGFLPKSIFEKSDAEDRPIYCQRCFRLRHYNEVTSVSLTDADFKRILQEIGEEDALLVNVVDLFDFNASLIPNLSRFIGQNDLLLVANKRDILPHSLKIGKLKNWLREEAAAQQLNPLDLQIISARREKDVRELMESIEEHRRGRNVYVVGVTNVGKSTLINMMIKLATKTDENNLITTSRFPGTTLGKIEIPLDESSFLVDTPGIIQQGQIAHYLKVEELKFVSPQKEIKPKTYQLNARQSLFFGGLARFDFISGKRQGITAYFENNLIIHRTKLDKASEFYQKHVGELLQPAIMDLEMIEHHFKVTGKTDLVISGLGWICVPSKAEVSVWAGKGVEVLSRKALI